MTPDDGPYRSGFDLGEFRHAAARYIKLLIRARWKAEPGFLPESVLADWCLQDIAADRWPAPELLDQAAAALGEINTHYIHRCGSGGVREANESTPEGRLVYAIAFLADIGNAGGPSHNGALVEASQHLRASGKIDWASLVAWDSIAAIRADLDLLPHPRSEAALQVAHSEETLARLKDIDGRLTELDAYLQHRQGMPEQEWFSIDEVAALTGLSADHVRRHVTGGTLPVCNQGTFEKPYYRIRRGDIDAWMSQRMQQPGPAPRKKTRPGSYVSRHHGTADD